MLSDGGFFLKTIPYSTSISFNRSERMYKATFKPSLQTSASRLHPERHCDCYTQ